MFKMMKERVTCGVVATSVGAYSMKKTIKDALSKKSEGVNTVVVAAIMLLIALVAVLLYWGFSQGVIQKVFTKVNAAIDELFS